MIIIEIKEDMNRKHGDAIGTECRFSMQGKGDVMASQVKLILDTFDKELPLDVWTAALNSFLSERGV